MHSIRHPRSLLYFGHTLVTGTVFAVVTALGPAPETSPRSDSLSAGAAPPCAPYGAVLQAVVAPAIPNLRLGYELALRGDFALASGAREVWSLERLPAGWQSRFPFGMTALTGGVPTVALADDRQLVGGPGVLEQTGVVLDCTWSELLDVVAGDAAESGFGRTMRAAGDLLLVAARYEGKGRVYLFRHTASGWVRKAKFMPPRGWSGNQFGFSADVMRFGGETYVAISGCDAGSEDDVFVYRGTGASFEREFSFHDGRASGPENGVSVLIGGANYPVVVTAPPASSDTVMVHRRSGAAGSWLRISDLRAPGNIALADFDGARLALARLGTVYLYEVNDTGASWFERGSVVGSPYDEFGSSVALDGSTMLVGAPMHSRSDASASGAVYVYAL
ncbi:MAG: FG-GAP repeat protein [Planctomycetota bacterium]